jgi:hypothetical protein
MKFKMEKPVRSLPLAGSVQFWNIVMPRLADREIVLNTYIIAVGVIG